MEAKIIALVLATTFSLALSSPVMRNQHQPNYDNVPQCMQPSASGMCLAYFPSYYYVPSKNTCESFVYGGCGGNANRFFSFEECMATCGGFQPETQNFTLILESDVEGTEPRAEESDEAESGPQVAESDPCVQPSVSGPCRARLPRFYFNGDACEEFIYGGCGANGNNFKSIEDCQQRCGSKSSEEVEARSEENKNVVSNEQAE